MENLVLPLPVTEDTTRLEIELGVYVPSTQGIRAQRPLSDQEMRLRVKSVQKFLADSFGGFTSFGAQGGYTLETGKLVSENVTKVTAFADSPMGDKEAIALISKCRYWCKKWGQEAIGLEHEGDLYFIGKK